MAEHKFRCGDIVRCVSKYHAEQLQISNRPGIVMGFRANHIHVWFEDTNRGFWIPFDILRAQAGPEISPLLHRIRAIAHLLDAEEWELEDAADARRLLCYVDEVPLETIMDLRAFLGAGYRSLSFKPEGMGRMIAQIEWAKTSEESGRAGAAGAGRNGFCE